MELLVADCNFGFFVEEVNLAGFESDFDSVAGLCSIGGFNTSVDGLLFTVHVKVGFSTHKLGNFNVSLNDTIGEFSNKVFLVVYIFRADTHDNFLADVCVKNAILVLGREGMMHEWGANVGKVFRDLYGTDIKLRARYMAAAGSDARMSGCEMPVIIVSGSGNQGITASVPVIEYAKELGVSMKRCCVRYCFPTF